MPKITVNPNAKRPDFVAVRPDEYRMKFQRLEEKQYGQSEKGNWWCRMRLVHTAPAANLLGLNGQPLAEDEMPGSVSAIFMLTDKDQGKVRQAFESAGVAWPSAAEAPSFETEEEYAEWIMQALSDRECVVRLKSQLGKNGEWQNEVSRYIVA